MCFDRFDICTAWYLFLSHYHDGQWSEQYRRLSRLTRHFRPSPLLTIARLAENGYENARGIFVDILESRGLPLPTELA